MRKLDLFELIKKIAEIAPEETLIIVGSQAVHSVTQFLPEIVQQSIECDFLFAGGKSETRAEINKKLGIFSEFQLEHGFYADALGLATVVLPTGWRERLQPLKDENGETIAYCAEIHDIAVSKFIAGREKDFRFLREAFLQGLIEIDVFLERVRLAQSMPQNAVISSRMNIFAEFLSKDKDSEIRRLLKEIKKFK